MARSSIPLTAIACLSALGCASQKGYRETTPVRISEVYFQTPTTQGKASFIEVGNFSKQAVDLSGWQVTGAGRIVLPPGTTLEPGKALVVSGDVKGFKAVFGASVTPVTTYEGKLKNSGETLRIEDPSGVVADEVSYDGTVPEVQKAAGTGLSLHRVSAVATSQEGAWKAAEPSPGVLERKTE
jgi:hypothetical protein